MEKDLQQACEEHEDEKVFITMVACICNMWRI
jgi:hypothetical protein